MLRPPPWQAAEARVQQRHAARVGRDRHGAAGGRPRQEVDHLHALLGGIVGDAHAAAAQPGDRRQGDAEREIGRDRGIAGAAAGGQHLAADLRGVRLVGDHGAAIADRPGAVEQIGAAGRNTEERDDGQDERGRELTPRGPALS